MIESFANSKVLFTLPWNTAGINGVAFIGNDKLAAANKKGDILIWNLTAPDGKTLIQCGYWSAIPTKSIAF